MKQLFYLIIFITCMFVTSCNEEDVVVDDNLPNISANDKDNKSNNTPEDNNKDNNSEDNNKDNNSNSGDDNKDNNNSEDNNKDNNNNSEDNNKDNNNNSRDDNKDNNNNNSGDDNKDNNNNNSRDDNKDNNNNNSGDDNKDNNNSGDDNKDNNNNSGDNNNNSGDNNNNSGDNNKDNNNSDNQEEKIPQEILNAFDYLNKVRNNPQEYSKEVGVELTAKPIKSLNWNDILYKVAQRKAEDMATRNYFDHVDPEGYGMNYYINEGGYKLRASFLDPKSNNYFESLAAGYSTGKKTIIQLLYDKGANDENAGHRQHLLGLQDFWANCYDIGIGMAYNPNSTYKYYWCILIAKHDF
ncbi:MAG: CAP domain-containing protein [Bacteroidales bacterium]|nr:CAP domain-containing protein [Bacteroidales bacterium]